MPRYSLTLLPKPQGPSPPPPPAPTCSNRRTLPQHLLTVEFYRLARSRLLDGGSLYVNFLAWPEDALFRTRAERTLRSVFAGCSAWPVVIEQGSGGSGPRAAFRNGTPSLTRFEPAGWTERMGYAHSVVDYLFRWLGEKFPGSGAIDPLPAVTDGETCAVCGGPVTWSPGSPCPDCGDIGLGSALPTYRHAAQPSAR